MPSKDSLFEFVRAEIIRPSKANASHCGCENSNSQTSAENTGMYTSAILWASSP